MVCPGFVDFIGVGSNAALSLLVPDDVQNWLTKSCHGDPAAKSMLDPLRARLEEGVR